MTAVKEKLEEIARKATVPDPNKKSIARSLNEEQEGIDNAPLFKEDCTDAAKDPIWYR